MFRTVTLRLKPNKTQVAALEAILRDCCETYNAGLQERKEAWKLQRKQIGLYDQEKELTELRKDPRFSTIALDIQRDPLRRLERSFRGFFRRCKIPGKKPGFPRFRSNSFYHSFSFGRVLIRNGKLNIPNMCWMKFKCSQPIPGSPKTAIVKRCGAKWIVRLVCDIGKAPEKTRVASAVGIDLGLKHLVTLSDGQFIANPHWEHKHERKISAANQSLSRKRKRSNNRIRAKEVLLRSHQRATSARRNFTHHVSKWLVSNYDLVAFEKLNICNVSRSAKGTVDKPGKNVAQKSGLNRSIMDAAWGELVWQITYKAESAGKWAIPVNPRGTSIKCSACGEPVPKTLADRRHICECGVNLDRDHNAAINILRLGEALRAAMPSERASCNV